MRRRDLVFVVAAVVVAAAAVLLLKPWPAVGAAASLLARRNKTLGRWSWLVLLASLLALFGSVNLSVLRFVNL